VSLKSVHIKKSEQRCCQTQLNPNRMILRSCCFCQTVKSCYYLKHYL